MMVYTLTVLATTATASTGDLFGSLGIDWKMLLLQTVAFLILLFLLSKYAYPVLLGVVEKREKSIADSLRAAHDAEANAKKTEEDIAALLHNARHQADEMIASAKDEAAALVDAAEKKSREHADRIVADAQSEIRNDIEKAKKALKKETIELVAIATEKVVGKTVTKSVDDKLIESAIAEVKRV